MISALASVHEAEVRAQLARRLLLPTALLLQISFTALAALDIARLGGLSGSRTVAANLVQVAAVLGAASGAAIGLCAALLTIRAQRALLRAARACGVEGLDPSLAWASWSWLVPGANLVVPFRSLRQLVGLVAGPASLPLTRLLRWWWTTWLLFWAGVAAEIGLAALPQAASGTWQLFGQLTSILTVSLLSAAGVTLATLLPLLASHVGEAAMLVDAAAGRAPKPFASPRALGLWMAHTARQSRLT